jgi:hypothetical protein|tara:strand:+ start:2449 stop:2646 length:198 start_codon:yes stop_codon:yes gene_type:complete
MIGRYVDPSILRTRTVGFLINLLNKCAEQMYKNEKADKLKNEIESLEGLRDRECRKGAKRIHYGS